MSLNFSGRHFPTDIIMQALQYPDIERTFTFHDIKAKGISDFEGNIHDKQQFSGHKTVGQVNVYDRRTEIVPTIGSIKKWIVIQKAN